MNNVVSNPIFWVLAVIFFFVVMYFLFGFTLTVTV